MSKRGQPEYKVQTAIVTYLNHVLPDRAFPLNIPIERALTYGTDGQQAGFHSKRKAGGVVTGSPDLILALPDGRCAWIEVKAPGGTVSDAQQAVHDRLRGLGHHVGVADSIEAARALLQRWRVPLRESLSQPVAEPKVRYERRQILTTDVLPF